MLISPANEEDLVAKLPAKPSMNIRGKERTDEVAEVLDAVHIRNGARDQKFWHRVRPLSLQGGAEPEPQTKKPFRSGRKDFGIGSHLACADAHYPLPPDLMRSGRDIRAMASKIKENMYSNMAVRAIARNRFFSTSAFGPTPSVASIRSARQLSRGKLPSWPIEYHGRIWTHSGSRVTPNPLIQECGRV
jgi:hypothetical protein